MVKKIRIKDIAEKSGVSVGTVDRILHNRPNVSKKAREKVETVLKEINYQPNMYASALAYNKSHTFCLLMPEHESEAYWEEIEEGTRVACEARRDFSIEVIIVHYTRFNSQSFEKAFRKVLNMNPSGVVLVPVDVETTKRFTDQLHERDIPFVLLDSYLPVLKPMSFFGQDSLSSGYFAAKILMLVAQNEQEIMLMKQTKNGMLSSKQQANREVGFRQYMVKHHPQIKIAELDLPLDEDKNIYDRLIGDFFAKHPNVHHGITMCSKAHIVADYLHRFHREGTQIMGYDMVEKNAICLREGTISFLIAQHAYMQGFNCVDTLFKAVVLKQPVAPINYMPIELLTKENMDFYRRTQL